MELISTMIWEVYVSVGKTEEEQICVEIGPREAFHVNLSSKWKRVFQVEGRFR